MAREPETPNKAVKKVNTGLLNLGRKEPTGHRENAFALGSQLKVSSAQETPCLEYNLDGSMVVHRKNRLRLVWYVDVGKAAASKGFLARSHSDADLRWSHLEMNLTATAGQFLVSRVRLCDGGSTHVFDQADIALNQTISQGEAAEKIHKPTHSVKLGSAAHKKGNTVSVSVTVEGSAVFKVGSITLFRTP